jgi:hypothetical protein
MTRLAPLALLAGLVAACAVLSPKPWDRFADGPELKVYGSDAGSDGKAVFAALMEEPELREFLRREGEPDSLRVIGGGNFNASQVELIYVRRATGNPHRVLLYPTDSGLIPRAPEPIAVLTPTPVRTRRPRAARPKPAATAAPVPSAVQRLECPIDPSRPDCRALCVPGATWEWCR